LRPYSELSLASNSRVRWRPAPARFIARTIGGPLHSGHDLSSKRIIEITDPVYI